MLLVLLGLHSRYIAYLRSGRRSWWCCWWLSNRRLELLNVGTLLKRSPSVGPERKLVLAASLYFSFCLKIKMIQLGKTSPFFVIKNMWQNHLNYPGSSAQAITIKATPAQTHFKRKILGLSGNVPIQPPVLGSNKHTPHDGESRDITT